MRPAPPEVDTPALLAELRVRRLARNLIELEDSDRSEVLIDPARRDTGEIARERAVLVERLARAAEHLAPSHALRVHVEAACGAHRARVACEPGSDEASAFEDAFAAALIAVRDAMRRTLPVR
jgi:hypothetical protein